MKCSNHTPTHLRYWLVAQQYCKWRIPQATSDVVGFITTGLALFSVVSPRSSRQARDPDILPPSFSLPGFLGDKNSTSSTTVRSSRTCLRASLRCLWRCLHRRSIVFRKMFSRHSIRRCISSACRQEYLQAKPRTFRLLGFPGILLWHRIQNASIKSSSNCTKNNRFRWGSRRHRLHIDRVDDMKARSVVNVWTAQDARTILQLKQKVLTSTLRLGLVRWKRQ